MDEFTTIYKNNIWGDDNNSEYKGTSGNGSKIEYNYEYIKQLKQFINKYKIKSVVDLGSGDFLCGNSIYNGMDIYYTGYDIYKDVIKYNSNTYKGYNFIHLDFYEHMHEIKSADLCIIKDVLQHWPLNHINTFLNYIINSKKFKYIYICNDYRLAWRFRSRVVLNNVDIRIGGYRPLPITTEPLKTFNPELLFRYRAKEVSVIYVYVIYVSLTSIFQNQNKLLQTLQSITVQSKKPDKIYLYLSEESYILDQGFKDKIITNQNLLKFIGKNNELIEIKLD